MFFMMEKDKGLAKSFYSVLLVYKNVREFVQLVDQ